MIILILSLLTAGLTVAVGVQFAGLRRFKREQLLFREQCGDASERIHQLEQELGALCNASVGAGEHVLRLEQQMQRIIERQNGLEMRSAGDRPYNQASQLVNRGANIDELVDSCGLTRGEAELLVMMQRGAA